MKLLAVSVSMGKEVPYMDKTVATGIFKEPVSGRVMLRTLNLDGDRQIDLRGHGGPYKAAHVYTMENYERHCQVNGTKPRFSPKRQGSYDSSTGARHLSPISKCPGSEESVMSGLQMMTTDSEQVLNGTVN